MRTYLHIFAVSENYHSMPFETIYESNKGGVDVASVIREFSELWGTPLKNMRCFVIDKKTYELVRNDLLDNKELDAHHCAFIPKKS